VKKSSGKLREVEKAGGGKPSQKKGERLPGRRHRRTTEGTHGTERGMGFIVFTGEGHEGKDVLMAQSRESNFAYYLDLRIGEG